MAQQFMCVHPYPDGGLPCTSSDQCIGSCIFYEEDSEPFCQKEDVLFGCFGII